MTTPEPSLTESITFTASPPKQSRVKRKRSTPHSLTLTHTSTPIIAATPTSESSPDTITEALSQEIQAVISTMKPNSSTPSTSLESLLTDPIYFRLVSGEFEEKDDPFIGSLNSWLTLIERLFPKSTAESLHRMRTLNKNSNLVAHAKILIGLIEEALPKNSELYNSVSQAKSTFGFSRMIQDLFDSDDQIKNSPRLKGISTNSELIQTLTSMMNNDHINMESKLKTINALGFQLKDMKEFLGKLEPTKRDEILQKSFFGAKGTELIEACRNVLLNANTAPERYDLTSDSISNKLKILDEHSKIISSYGKKRAPLGKNLLARSRGIVKAFTPPSYVSKTTSKPLITPAKKNKWSLAKHKRNSKTIITRLSKTRR